MLNLDKQIMKKILTDKIIFTPLMGNMINGTRSILPHHVIFTYFHVSS